MIRFTAVMCLCFCSAISFAADKVSSADFLKTVRMPPGRESWASMKGKAMHRRKGAAPISAPIYFGVKFSPERTLAQVVIDEAEGYYVGQAYDASKDSTSIIPMKDLKKGETSKLAEFGLRAQDLAMSFLYWEFQKELEEDSVKGQDCRVFLLKDPKSPEVVKVHISSEFYFPLKVQWYAQGYVEDKEQRTLEIREFEKKDNFWLVSELSLFGPAWKSRVEFEDAKAGYTKGSNANIPTDLFITLK